MRPYSSLSYILLVAISLLSSRLSSQDLSCEPDVEYQGEVFMNYGSTTNGVNADNRTTLSIGQTVVGQVNGENNRGSYGYFSRFLLPPSEPVVTVSQGDFPDRVQLSWRIDPLSPVASDGIKIFRDGAFLVDLPIGTDAFIDFNVQAGEFYEYEVIGYNDFGTGYPRSVVGFVNPNGVVNGRVTTNNGNPVKDVTVTLSPTISNSLQFDGVDDYVCISYDSSMYIDQFTVSTWIKIGSTHDQDGIIDYGSNIGDNWWIKTTASSQAKGVSIGVGNNGAAQILEYEFVNNPDAWHHVAATFNGSNLILYVDGAFIDSRGATMTKDSTTVSVGRSKNGAGYFDGLIDDVRILNRAYSQTEIQQTMNSSLSSLTPGLVAYWKMDEGIGENVFDISPYQSDGLIFGATYATDDPGVLNAGVTDEAGFYTIEGINYSSTGSFIASPQKSFHFNYGLEFSAADLSSAQLTDFDLPDSSTVELVFNAFDIQSKQALLSKENSSGDIFEIYIASGSLHMRINSESHPITTITKGYHHMAITMEQIASDLDCNFYLNGVTSGTKEFTGVNEDLSGGKWTLGRSAETGVYDYYTGLIDEVVFYKNLSDIAEIQLHANFNRNLEDFDPIVADTNLLSYFNLNEGQDMELRDLGPVMTGLGSIDKAKWTTNVAMPEVVPHEFTPNTRQVNINESNTAIGNIDFTDISTVAISGVVRYADTFCWTEGVELLVNGASHVPPIMTDADGRFVADFEPGTDIKLTPVYQEHEFFPTFFEVRKIASPVAGVLFQDKTVRSLEINVVGGLCRKSIIPSGKKVTIEIASTGTDCYSKIVDVTSSNGNLKIENLPPIPLSVSVISQTVQEDLTAFFGNNGLNATIDLTLIENATVDFIYRVAPQIMTTELPKNIKGVTILEQTKPYSLDIEVTETYHGGTCLLDSAIIRINNNIADLSSFDTMMTSKKLVYSFTAGQPRLVGDYSKNIQVVAETDFGTSDKVLNGVVTGKVTNETSFISTSPEIPFLILRDPPGDASYAQLSKGQTSCSTWSFEAYDATNENGFLNIYTGLDASTTVGIGATTSIDIDATRDFTMDFNATAEKATTQYIETCLTTTDVFSTSNSEDFISGDGDIFVGAAINFLFGSASTLDYDTALCAFLIDTVLIVAPDSFATTFIRSERDILANVIPDLEFANDTTSAKRWRAILAENDTLKKQAIFQENFSFDAGVVFERSITTSRTESNAVSYFVEDSENFAATLGLTVNGVGLEGGFGMTMTTSETRENGTAVNNEKTITYVLSDNDVGDNFTLDVLNDPKYGTPVFNLKSGRTSCPHEQSTLRRHKVDMTIDKNVAINIPSNNQAVFFLEVANLSDEFNVYSVTAFPNNNPDGAAIRIGTLASTSIGLEPGETKQLTMTVGRGPVAYDYTNLGVAIYSECEKERADRLGVTIDPLFFKELFFDVQYIQPCSEIDITSPNQDWVVTPDDNKLLNIRLADYDKNDAELVKVLVQYRRVGGSGAWLPISPISELPKDSLGPVSTIVEWDMGPLVDGPYEIRAVTNCSSTTLEPGISTVIKGRLETSPPEVFGTPQPADGILSANDEISITYNEFINCDAIVLAERIGTQVFNQNLGLYDKTSGDLIDASISCADDKIIIIPNIQNKFIENRTLEVRTDQIQDLSGNKTEEIKWEFLVDRNPFLWLGPDIDELMTVNEPITVKRQILNRGGVTAGFEIRDVPSWVTVEPNNININPGEIVEITFTFQDDLLIGDYQQAVSLYGTEGEEPLDIRLMVRCESPNWEFNNAAAFENSMNFALEVDIFGDLSTDISDIVVAYINGEIRGISNIEYIRELDKYIAFLTVHHDGTGDEIVFNVFDGNKCIIYADIMESYNFSPGSLIGSPIDPEVIHVENIVERTIPLAIGWNWISFNIDLVDNTIGNVLSSLSNPNGATIKEANVFSRNLNDAWIGSMEGIGYEQRYMYKSIVADTLKLKGIPYDLSTSGIVIDSGWNWIGFVPQNGMSLELGLQSLNPQNGDLIKSQTEFAQYVVGTGWIGNLNFLNPGNGYLLSISNSGNLVYPEIEQNFIQEEVERNQKSNTSLSSVWKTNPHQYSGSMNVIADIKKYDKLIISEGDELAVIIDDEIRGSGQAQYVPELETYRFFITVYGNESSADLSFRYLNKSGNEIYNIVETESFNENTISGCVLDPLMLSIGTKDPETSELPKSILKTGDVNILGDIPNQLINAGETFDQVDVSLFVQEDSNCSTYDVQYIITTGDQSSPACTKGTYPSSMTGFLKLTFGDSLAFNSLDDRLILYDQNDVIVDCAVPFADPMHPNEKIFFLNVGGAEQSFLVDLEFYSASHNKIYRYENAFEYIQDGTLRSPEDPLVINFSPLNFEIVTSTLSVDINEANWKGTQGVIVTVSDCDDNLEGSDTIYYSIVETGATCIDPIIFDINVLQPTSQSCILSNADGAIEVITSFADSFSIDGGQSYSANNSFTALVDGNYNIVVKGIEGCQAVGGDIILDNDAYLAISVKDTTVNCVDRNTISLTAEITHGTGPYIFEWKNSLDQLISSDSLVKEGQYFVTVTDAQSCTAMSSLTIIREVNPLDWALSNSISGDVRVCANEQDVLYRTSTDTAIADISWHFTNDNVTLMEQAGGKEVLLDYNDNAANGWLILTASNYCDSFVDSLYIVVNDLDIATTDITTNCLNTPLAGLSATAISGNAPYQFEWTNVSNASVADNSQYTQGKFYVTLIDGDMCEVQDSLLIAQEADPLDQMGADMILGPSIVCKDQNLNYELSTNMLGNDISWTYDSEDVVLMESSAKESLQANFGDMAISNYLHVEMSNYCSMKSDSLLISFASPFICQQYSNCPPTLHISGGILESLNAPNVYQASQTMTLTDMVPNMYYEFSAGQSLEFQENFEVPQGHAIKAEIKDCSN